MRPLPRTVPCTSRWDGVSIAGLIERLKDEAASLGANGILLEGVGGQQTGTVGTGFGSATANGYSAFGEELRRKVSNSRNR